MTAPDYITNHSSVVAFYGYWRSFHDAEVSAYKKPTATAAASGLRLTSTVQSPRQLHASLSLTC